MRPSLLLWASARITEQIEDAAQVGLEVRAWVDARHFAQTASELARSVALTALFVVPTACTPDESDAEALGWEQVPSPTQSQLDAVWGTGPADVWAVGHEGVALQYDGNSWNQVATGASGSLLSLWGASPQNYWAGSIDGNVLKWDGQAWTPDPWFAANNTDIVESISGSGPDDVWVATTFSLFRWNGATWSEEAIPDSALVDNVHVVGPGEAWITGDSRDLFRKRGQGTWELFQVPDVGGVFIWNDISGCSSTDMWAVGLAVSAAADASFGYHWDGAAWSEVQFFSDPRIAPGSLEAVWCRAANDVWTVGLFENYHFDGSRWRGSLGAIALGDIWGAANGELWAVGSVGAILHHGGP